MAQETRAPAAPARDPHRPTETSRETGTWPLLKRTGREFMEDGLTDWASALTYQGLLSLFPALLAISAIVGLATDPDTLTEALLEIAPASAADTLSGPIESITSSPTTGGLMLVVGLVGALWASSSYVAAFGRAANTIYETREGRPFWKLRPLQMLITLVMVLLLAVVTIGVVFTGPVVDSAASVVGAGDTAVTLWNYGKWPVLAVAVVVMFAFLFWSTPNARLRGIRDQWPGVVLALAAWLVASMAFAAYVANFGSYDKTYGTLGGVIVLLIWLWITNVALLMGVELNAERERGRELRAGVPGAQRRIKLPPREEPDPRSTR